MMRILLLSVIPLICSAFSLTNFVNSEKSPVIAGSTKPIESFDPLGLAKDDRSLFFFREAELKHGRLAMVSALTIPIVDQITGRPAIHEFDHLPDNVQLGVVGIMFISEFASMLRGWKDPLTNPFELKDEYQPGDLGFFLKTDFTDENNIVFLNKELNNGRLAMIGALGMLVQELITNKPLF
jgi:hypothetical protein